MTFKKSNYREDLPSYYFEEVSEDISSTCTPPLGNSPTPEKIPPTTLKQLVRIHGKTLVDLCNEVNFYRKISYRQIKKYGSATAPGTNHTWNIILIVLSGWGVEFQKGELS